MDTPPQLSELLAGPRWYRPEEELVLCSQAALRGDLDEVKRLAHWLLYELRLPPDVTQPEPSWLFGSLDAAMEARNVEIMRFLLDLDVVKGDLPVEFAVRMRSFEALEVFLEYGLDINKPLHRNEPPVLCIAIYRDDREMIDWLLDHGADPNARCVWDYTPTSIAVYIAPLNTIDYLFSRGADIRCGQLLHHAAHRPRPDALAVVRRLVELGAPINEIKYEKEPNIYREREPFGLGTPLHRAAEFGKADVVEYLLEHGADPLKLDSKRKTPRFWAEEKNHAEAARILKEAEDRQSGARPRPTETSNL